MKSLFFRKTGLALLAGSTLAIAALSGCEKPAPPAEGPAQPAFDYKKWYEGYAKEVIEARDLDKAAKDYWSENIIYHNVPQEQGQGAEKVKALLAEYYSAFSDVKVTIDDVIYQGNTVVARITFEGKHTGKVGDFAPTGKIVKQTITSWYWMKENKISDIWTVADTQQVLEQIKGEEVDCSKCAAAAPAAGSGDANGSGAPANGSGAAK